MKLILPEQLFPGDTIGIACPASAPPDPNAIDRSIAAIEQMGFKYKLARNARKRLGFLAGTDRERAADLMNLFSTRTVRAIICVRGGYGSARVLPHLDFPFIRANPKIVLGYSDITSLHCALLRHAGLVSYHGPMFNSDFIQPEMPEFTRESFRRTLMLAEPAGSICATLAKPAAGRKASREPDAAKVDIIRKGKARGPLVGGNLTVLCATLGTPWQPSFRRAILFFEDLGEVPYRFDRMLTQLLHSGALSRVEGIAIGTNKDCADPKAGKSREYRQTLRDVFEERLSSLKVPIVGGLPFGHVPLNATLPVGLPVTLDGDSGDLGVDTPAVTEREN